MRMKKWLSRTLLLFTVALLPSPLMAQFTNVTATVKDASNNIYPNCKYGVDFVIQSSASQLSLLDGVADFQKSYGGAACDSNGTLAIRLPDNNRITPTPSQWKFSICDSSGTRCFTLQVTITGVNQDITAAIQAVPPPSMTTTSGFTDLTVSHSLDITGAMFKGYDVFVNAFDDCGLIKDNVTDNWATFNTCYLAHKSAHYIFPGCGFNPQGGGTANVPCYYFSQQIVASYNGTWFDGTNPSVWNGLVGLRFPSGVAGVRFDTNCYGCKISNLALIGGDLFSSTNLTTWPDWTPASLVGNGPDGLQMLGGSQRVENVVIQGFGRHGIFLDGSGSILPSSQPDSFHLSDVVLSSNRANGFFSVGCDSNVGMGEKLLTRGNMLTGIYDYSCLGNTWTEPDSALDGRSAVSAGGTSNITSISDNGATILTIVTATPVAGWVNGTWITVAGTVNYNGTYKVTGGTSSNFTANYLGTPQAGEVVGTAQTASSANIFAQLTARSAGAGQAPTKECAYSSRSGSSVQVWINPYQESNSAPPCWDTGTIVLGGQLASTVVQASGQGFLWITAPAGGLLMKGGQSFTFQNPADSLTTLNIKAGATALQDESLRFIAFDGTIKHTLKVSSVGSSLSFTDTSGVSWFGKNIGGAAFLRGGGATEDIAYMQNSGRDELHYCGTGAVCSKLLNSDTNLYVNSLVPMTINAGGVGTNARPFPSIFLGTAATNNIAITPTAMAAARTITVNDPLANATLRTEISGTDTTDLASVANGACSPDSGAITVTGARAGDEIHVTAATVLETGGYLIGRVTANNAAKYQFCNQSGGAIDRASDTYTLRVKK
jgi:hypothetical protein